MNGGREHRVPLSAPALSVLEKMAKIRFGAFVFGSSAHRPISNMAMLMLLRRMGRDDLTVYGMASRSRTKTCSSARGDQRLWLRNPQRRIRGPRRNCGSTSMPPERSTSPNSIWSRYRRSATNRRTIQCERFAFG
jgi:hypothetical protein